jgi:hypothetical protein
MADKRQHGANVLSHSVRLYILAGHRSEAFAVASAVKRSRADGVDLSFRQLTGSTTSLGVFGPIRRVHRWGVGRLFGELIATSRRWCIKGLYPL